MFFCRNRICFNKFRYIAPTKKISRCVVEVIRSLDPKEYNLDFEESLPVLTYSLWIPLKKNFMKEYVFSTRFSKIMTEIRSKFMISITVSHKNSIVFFDTRNSKIVNFVLGTSIRTLKTRRLFSFKWLQLICKPM